MEAGSEQGGLFVSLAQVLQVSALRYPDRPAVLFEGQATSYARLWSQVGTFATMLGRSGLQPGDRVALMCGNSPAFPVAYYGILAAGAVVVPVHTLLAADEIKHLLEDSGSTVMFVAESLADTALQGADAAGVHAWILDDALWTSSSLDGDQSQFELVPRSAADDAVVLYTSGTTGKPKGAVLTHFNLVLNTTVAALDLYRLVPEDVVLGCLPLFHSFGQTCAMNGTFRVGGTLVLLERFTAGAALELMLAHDVTVFFGVPTMYIALLAAGDAEDRRPPLRVAASGGAPLPLAVLEAFEAAYHVSIWEGYGLSETSPVAASNDSRSGLKPGTVGHQIWGVEVQIADPEIELRIELVPTGSVGEVVIRGHNVFKGYLNRPEATAAAIVDGWFRTGDLGTRDSDGFITIVDRKKDLILRGGYNVYPREVEEVLAHHPGIAQVSVIGIPHPTHGEEVCAVIVARPGVSVDSDAFIEWSRERLAKYKYPRVVSVVDQLPVGPSGKVLKRELREQLLAR